MQERQVYVEGHRGWCAVYPENTLISFEAAIDLGVDAIEFDIRLTKDNIPVVMHDGNAKRTCCVNKEIKNMTLAQVKNELEPAYKEKFGDKYVGKGVKVPTFEELCILASTKRPDIHMGTEIKINTFEAADITVAMLKKYGLFENAWFYLHTLKMVEYIKTKYGGRTMGYPAKEMKGFSFHPYKYYDELGLSLSAVEKNSYKKYARKGLPIHMFCADNEENVRFFLSKPECNLITANDPVPLMKVLGRRIGQGKDKNGF